MNDLTKKVPFKSFLILSVFGFLTISCNNDDNPQSVDEEEVITTMTITLTSDNGTATIQSRDIDADGPDEPVITADNLSANTTYTGAIGLLNEAESPAENVTEEIEEEDDEHQFFFSTEGSISDVSYTDEDDNGNPIGLAFTLTTGDAGNGTLQVTLRHQPNKPNDGTLSDAGGDTDIAQTFSLVVE